MIKAVMHWKGDDRPSLLIGLSRKNCELLLEGKPIVFDGEVLGLETLEKVVVIGGETEEAMTKDLEKTCGPFPVNKED